MERNLCTPRAVPCSSVTLTYVGPRTDRQDPRATLVYAEHTQPVTVARISPSGYYAASADISGSVRVWDLASGERILKLQTQALNGKVSDLAWDGESKRIIVVGEGRERFAHAFMFDSGSSVGEISGHSKPMNAVAIRHQRPFRAVTAGDDTHLVFFTGVPFKFNKTLSGHTRFVQDVAYAKDGMTFASVGSDGQLLLYDGVSGETKQTVANAHTGTVYAVRFAPDSAHVVTAGADGLVKVWRTADAELVASFDAKTQAANKVDAQQVGVVWAQPGVVVSIGLEGVLYVLDVDVAAGTLQLRAPLVGPTKGVSSLVYAAQTDMVGVGSYDGRVYTYRRDGGASSLPQASGAPSVVGVGAERDDGEMYAIALDDTVGRIARDAPRVALTAQPRGLAMCGAAQYVVSERGVDVVEGTTVTHRSAAQLGAHDPTAIAATSAGDALVAIGTADAQVRLYTRNWDEVATLTNGRSPITALSFSPDGKLLAAGESSGKILVYDVAQLSVRLTQWVFHSARIAALAWSASGEHCASASLDTHVYVWSVARPMKQAAFKNAHAGGATGVAWLDGATLATSGADGVVRQFAVTLP